MNDTDADDAITTVIEHDEKITVQVTVPRGYRMLGGDKVVERKIVTNEFSLEKNEDIVKDVVDTLGNWYAERQDTGRSRRDGIL
jgi:hypothetical protein